MMEERSCVNCGAKLFEQIGQERKPCPVCGGLRRAMTAICEDTLLLIDGMRMKARREGVKRPIWEACNVPSFYYKTKSWHRVERHLDRERDAYVEIITDMKSGEVIQHIEEPLSQHNGHGSAKTNREEG